MAAKPLMPVEIAQENFYCDSEKGILYWKIKRKAVTKDKVAGCLKNHGYKVVNFERKTYFVHRLIWMLCTGKDPYPHIVDHINGITDDNRLCNLRLATKAENTRNQKLHPLNTSGYKGVSYIKRTGKWDARIKYNYVQYCLGVYTTKKEAYEAYCEAAQRLHGDFWCPG